MIPNDNIDLTNVLNSLIGTLGAVEMRRLETPLVAQTAANPAPNVSAAKANMPLILAGGAVLTVALFLALK